MLASGVLSGSKLWRRFADAEPWWVPEHQTVSVGDTVSRPPTAAAFDARFPKFSTLLRAARLTPLAFDGADVELLTWESERGPVGWMCPPASEAPEGVCSDHAMLLREFGGVRNRLNEWANTWLLNHNSALTVAGIRDAAFVEDYAWKFPGERVPIPVAEYYSIADECNGNTTLCHRRTGEVLLFATDHSFDHIVPFEGCDAFSLYRIPEAATFRAWVERIADQWLRAIAPPRAPPA